MIPFRAFLLLCIFAWSQIAVYAALPTGLIWEIRGGGAAANGGGFNPGNANFLTDFTATSATGNSPVISSASYNFVAGDVDAWIYVKSGTNWTPGFYKITSVASNNATVNAAVGAAVQVTNGIYATNTVAGCATVASPTGGTCGVDYSQQNGAELSITDAASVASSTTLTSATAGFTPVMVGNLFHLTTQGTSSRGIIGWYEIVSYNSSSSVETDVTTNNGAGDMAAATGAVGGAIATLGAIGSATARLGCVAGNIIWVNGSFTMTTTTDTLAGVGTATNPIRWIGYGTIRGDGYLGRTSSNGPIITTNFPTITYTTGRLNFSGAFQEVECLNVTGASTVAQTTLGQNSGIRWSKLVNSGTGASSVALTAGNSQVRVIGNDIALTGASGGLAAFNGATATNTYVLGNRINGGPSAGATSSTGAPFYAGNTIFGGAGAGISVTNTGGVLHCNGNTIVGNGGAGISIVSGATQLHVITNNCITDHTGADIDFGSTAVAAIVMHNRTRDNGSHFSNAGDWVLQMAYGNVTTDTGGDTTDYVSPGSPNYDYNLISTSPAKAAGFPYPSSIGALQFLSSGGGERITITAP